MALKRIYTNTPGDWHIIETENGRKYMLTGLKRAAFWSQLKADLENQRVHGEVFSDIPIDEDMPEVIDIAWDANKNMYVARMDNGGMIELSEQEVATMLYNK